MPAALLSGIHVRLPKRLGNHHRQEVDVAIRSRIDALLAGSNQLALARLLLEIPTRVDARAQKEQYSQVAALPFRIKDGKVEVLLVTSRETKRWLIPKGWPMKGKKPHKAAAQEAEEAGVKGEIKQKPLGYYDYWKRRATHFDLCRVDVYPLEVSKQLRSWRRRASGMPAGSRSRRRPTTFWSRRSRNSSGACPSTSEAALQRGHSANFEPFRERNVLQKSSPYGNRRERELGLSHPFNRGEIFYEGAALARKR